DHFGWFFEQVKALENYESLYAWDIMNEPELCGEEYKGQYTGLTMSLVRDFVREFSEKIHSVDINAKTTVGSLTKADMAENWIIPDNALSEADISYLDFYQFHLYDSSRFYHDHDLEDMDFARSVLSSYCLANDGLGYFYAPVYSAGKLIIGGEIDPTFVDSKTDIMADYGYDGMLYWDDKGNMLNAGEYDLVKNWFRASVYTWYEGSGRPESEKTAEPDGSGIIYRSFLDEAFYFPGTLEEKGRVLSEILYEADEWGAMAYIYEYTDTGAVKKAYHSAEFTAPTRVPVLSGLVYSEDIGDNGTPVPESRVFSSVYYGDSWLKKADILTGECKYYLNENWEKRGYGREIMEERDGKAYVYSVMSEEYQRFGQWEWSSVDTSDPDNPVFSGFIRYNGGWNGSTVEYYNPADPENMRRMRSRSLPSADSAGNEYYHYIDEDIDEPWNSKGVPRSDAARLKEANEKGERSFVYEYYTDSTSVRFVRSYSVSGEAPGDLSYNDRVAVYEYDTSGRIRSASFKNANSKNEMAFEYEYYGDSRDLSVITAYADENRSTVLRIYEYGPGGEFSSVVTAPLAGSEVSTFLMDEVLSKQAAITGNREEFTGSSPEEETYIPKNGIQE
ncbi:MAG: hypothetical protein ABH883_01180, partial [Candidatus Omnitrophota bacterium]